MASRLNRRAMEKIFLGDKTCNLMGMSISGVCFFIKTLGFYSNNIPMLWRTHASADFFLNFLPRSAIDADRPWDVWGSKRAALGTLVAVAASPQGLPLWEGSGQGVGGTFLGVWLCSDPKVVPQRLRRLSENAPLGLLGARIFALKLPLRPGALGPLSLWDLKPQGALGPGAISLMGSWASGLWDFGPCVLGLMGVEASGSQRARSGAHEPIGPWARCSN